MIKKLSLSVAFLAIAGLVNGQLVFNTIPNGDFEAADDTTTWATASGPGVVFGFPNTGGNSGGFGSIDASNGEWAVLVSPFDPGASGGGVPVADLGLTAGTSVDFKLDMKNLNGPGVVGGMKIEAWAANAIVGNSGDIRPATIGDGSTWETYTVNWTLPGTTEKLIFVPLWGASTVVGYDNVGAMGTAVIPEPSTYAFLGGLAALGLVMYRRRK